MIFRPVSLLTMEAFLRYQLFCIYGVIFLGLWIALRSTEGEGSHTGTIINHAPLFLVAGLGVYALVSIVYGVVNMQDCPEAAVEVEKDVKEAKAAMAKKGVI